MASIVTNLTCELTTPVSVVFLPGNMFSMDNGGNIINVFVVQNGEPATLGGSVSANVIRSDGTTVAITGAIEGNKAYIILPQACYAVPGIIHIVMKITEGTTITTIAAITANVYQSSTDAIVDPGTLVPSVAALIEAIEDAVDSIPVDYSGLLLTLAADYSSSKTYPIVGMYAWQGGVLKRNIVPITTAESYTAAHWTNAVIGDDLTNLKGAIEVMKDAETDSVTAAWSDAGTENYPKGWAKGYYNKDTGASASSNVYIRSNSTYYFLNPDATMLEVTAPNGYHVAAYEYKDDADSTFVARHGDPSDTGTSHIIFSFEKGHKFRFAMGKFSNQSDAESHYADSSFLATCVAKFIVTTADTVNEYVLPGNNLLPLKSYKGSLNGITVTIENGVMTIKGQASNYIRMKLSGEYSMISTSVPSSWKSETMTGFEANKKYSIHNQVLSGNLPDTVGVSLRDSSGSSLVSVSIPEATIASVPAFAMLYVPSGADVDVTFIPMFVNGGLDDEAYQKKLNPYISIDGVKTYTKPDMSADFIYDSTLESAVKLPTSYVPAGEPTPLIILCHGLSSTISASTWGSSDMEGLVGHFVDEGFAVIDVNQVTTQDWCNPALIAKYVAAIRKATDRYNVVPKIVYGESMGSLIGLCIAKLYPSVKACVIAGIRLDLAARYSSMSSAEKAIVDENLGFTDGYDAFIAAGWDKTAISCVTNGGDKVCPVDFPPTFFVVGSTDTLTKTESLAKIDEIKRGGTICKTTEYTGNHNAVCFLKSGSSLTDAVAWMKQWI